jgi:hypothetical protein
MMEWALVNKQKCLRIIVNSVELTFAWMYIVFRYNELNHGVQQAIGGKDRHARFTSYGTIESPLFHSGFFGSGGYCTVVHCQVSLRAQPLVCFEVVIMPVIGGVSQGKVYSKQSRPPDVRTQHGDPTSEECLAVWKAGISKRQA